MKRLPPLSTLPVLEAAARLQSFSAAAAELNVTHGAVSHQIRSLEENVGTALFVRQGRRVVLTAEGAAFAEAIRAALGKISGAVEVLSPSARERKLKISVLPSFASRWLMPRLGKFLEANPLLIGMTAETNIIIRETEDALLLPSSAIELGRVWLLKNGKLVRTDVEIGAKDSDQEEIISGITQEDMVVRKPTLSLNEGQNARPNLVQWKTP